MRRQRSNSTSGAPNGKSRLSALIRDAQLVFQDAATLTGEKAAEARQRGMQILDAAMLQAQHAQTSAMVTGKAMAVSADHYVKENPWRMITVAASAGLLLGVILGRK
jgi:ElaB/YqjD/DUF883 family membrane-anchored ribosome-binding protein